MKIKPHVLRTGARNWEDEAQRLRTDDQSLSGHRAELLGKNSGLSAPQAPESGPQNSASPRFSLASGDFMQDWSDTGLITTNDNWGNVPAIVGYLGDDATTTTADRDPRLITAAGSIGAADVIANLTGTTSNSGGVGEFQITNPTIGLQGSGTADTPSIVLYLDSTGRENIRLRCNIRDIDSTVSGSPAAEENAVQQFNIQYRTDGGTWINVPGGYFADVTALGATMVTAVDIILPAGAANAGALEIRMMTVNAGGSDEWVGIDDIIVSSTPIGGGDAGTLAIVDGTPTFEGDSGTTDFTFTVTRTGGTTGAVSATWTVNLLGLGGTANAADFAGPLTGSVNFADGEDTKTITVSVNGDLAFEVDEGFTVTLSAATGGATLGDAVAEGNILNDDTQPTISIGDVTQAELDSNTSLFTFTVTLSKPAGSGGVTFDIATADGSALAGVDYVAQSLTGVTISEGNSTYTFNVTVNGDIDFEPDESFFVNITNVVNAIPADAQGQGTITNDDAAPNPGTLNIGDVDLAEGDFGATSFTFTVNRSGGSLGAVSATYTVDTSGGPGVADAFDFAPASPLTGTVNFADGQTSATITVFVLGETLFETDETFLVTLSDPQGGVTIGNGSGTGTILNDDPPPAGTFSIDDITLAEGDAGTTSFTFTVTRSGGSAGTVTVDYATAPDSATDGSDYTGASGTLTFLDGELTKTVTVLVNGDTDIEASEAFFVNLTNATGGASITDGQGVGTITNDDIPPAPGSVSVSDVSIIEGNAGTSILTFTITRTGGSGAFDINYATSNGGTPGNAPATAGSDYLAASGTVSFGTGVDTQTVSITINGDLTPELSEEFTLTLSGATNGATIADGTAIGTIVADDAPPASTLVFSEDFTGFTPGGFAPNPTADQIDSDIWRVVGLSDIPNPAYGFTAVTQNTDFRRTSIGATDPTAAGVYSLDSNAAMIIQATSAEMEAGGFIEARILNTSGSTATGFDVGFDWVYRNNADRSSSLQFSYSTDGTNFINVPAAAFATPGTLVSGAAFAYQNELLSLSGLSVANGDAIYFRWTHVSSSGSGNRDEFGIDNVTVSTTGGATGPLVSVSDVTVNEAAGTMTFTVTRANVADGAFTVDYATADGTALAGSDYVATSGTLSFGANQLSTTVTVTINNDGTPELNETLFLNLSNPTGGATIADGQAVGTITNDDGTPIQVSVNDVSIVEGQSGTSILTFTVTRTGGTGAFDVSFATADDTASAGSDYVATSGLLSFGAGVNTQTVSVTINGDLTQELTERFFVNLSNPTNDAIIVDGQGIGTIVNDEPTLIHDIQGTAYFSPLLAGEGINAFNIASTSSYTVRAIVTAVDNVGTRQGFYITEEVTDWDGNVFTSEGIFVMTRNDNNVGTVVSGVAVGDLVQFNANIMEYQAFSSMPRTVLVNHTGLVVVSSGNDLPSVTLTNIPNAVMTVANPDYFDSVDGVGDTFDASRYALSYFETVEGMLVTIPNMVVADGFIDPNSGDFFQAYSLDSANPGQINSRGGYTISGDPPLAPPDTPTTDDDTVNGGQVLHDGDVNPDIIELDFTDFAIDAPAGLRDSVSMGDFLGDVTGIIDFDFTDRKLFVTDIDPGSFVEGTPTIETTILPEDSRSLTVATFNVENLDPTDGAARFAAIANAIANNLNSPDIICIEEMQDNNGDTASGGADASTTWGMLVAALNAATGKVYQWVDQEPNGSEGGEPGGNIRVGFLYDTGRVQLGNLGADATLAERRQYTDRIGDGVRDAGDLIAFSDNMLGSEVSTSDWAGTRRSLLGEFNFNGNTVYVTANHWPAKGGSGNFWQLDQSGGDPANSDWAQRNAVAQDVYSMLNLIEQTNANAGIVAGGDFNDFYFYRPLTTVTGHTMADGSARVGGARFENLTLTLSEAERYTYTFDGRSQAIDHIIVNGLLGDVATYDIVHLNTGFNVVGNPQLSDHDPGLASFDYRNFSEILSGTAAGEFVDGFGGNDGILGAGGGDVLAGGTGNDSLHGQDGNDGLLGGVGNDFLSGGNDDDALHGEDGDDVLVGDSGNDFLSGGAGFNVYYGGTGNDVYVVASAADYVVEHAGEGTDLLYTAVDFNLSIGQEIEILSAGEQAGTADIDLGGNELNNILWGNAGVNILSGLAGNDNLHGFGGADGLLGGDGLDFLDGGDGDDSLHGGDGIDTLIGGGGSDFMNGGAGADVMYGGTGNDIYIAENGDYILEHAGEGSDLVYATTDFALSAGSEIETLVAGGAAAVNLTGNELVNTLQGNDAANVLDGKGGNDLLIGGGGADTFAFTTAIGGGHFDVIADFEVGVDKIALDDAIFTAIGGLGALNANAFVTGTTAADSSDRIIYNSATGQLFYDADGTGSGASIMFATVSPGLVLTANDFQVI